MITIGITISEKEALFQCNPTRVDLTNNSPLGGNESAIKLNCRYVLNIVIFGLY